MNLERRKFSLTLGGMIALPWLVRTVPAAQQPGDMAPQTHPQEVAHPPDGRPDRSAETIKSVLEQNQNQIKKDVERLYELATQLKNEVEKTDSSKILSLNLVKKAEEAEKLAKQIKALARS